jgi:DNA-binding response OmpR family regulator
MSKKVLIIEDEIYIAEALKEKMLTIKDLEVDIASNGVEGKDKIIAFQPDLIFLDIIMPDMDGLEMIKSLDSDVIKRMKIVVITNLSERDKEKDLIELGVDEVLLKSDMSIDDIHSLAQKYLGL